MKKNFFIILFLILLPFLVGCPPSETIHVPADYGTIQEAIDAASDGALIVEILIQRGELHRIPSNPNTESEAALTEQIQRCSLLRHQRCLPLR